MKWLEHQKIRYALSHHPVSHEEWAALMRAKIFTGLSAVERAHLRELTILFLQRKRFSGVKGLTVSMEMALAVAAQASLLVLKLGLNFFDGWVEVVLYPAAFQVERDISDAAGIVSHEKQALNGESWSHGPVVLSWDEVASDLESPHSGGNVVVHEFAHKLDMLNGRANGMPPLHADMIRQQWTSVFSDAFDHLQQQVQHSHADINQYGASNPAEFFAVVSEYFFTSPKQLFHLFPEVYAQLSLFYRQDPVSRLSETLTGG